MNVVDIRDLFYNELNSDRAFLESIWINYPENRMIREYSAHNQFVKLYSGVADNSIETNTELQNNLSILDMFIEFSKEDLKLSKKLIMDIFNDIKISYTKNTHVENQNNLISLKELIEYIGIDEILSQQRNFERLKKVFSSNQNSSLKDKIDNKNLTIQELEELKLEILQLNTLDELNYKDIRQINNLIQNSILEIEKIINQKKIWNEILKKLSKEYELYYKKIKELKEIWGDNSLSASLGWDLSSSHFTEENLLKLRKNKEFIEIENNEVLNKLIKMLGNSSQRKKTVTKMNSRKGVNTISKNELLGIHQSSDLSRVLPSELSYLNNKYLKYLFYLKYAESQLSTYLIADNSNEADDEDKNKAEGPFIACIDTSSSMEGLPETISKSIIIKLIEIAKKQKRKIYLIIFGSTDEIQEFEIDYTKENSEKLYEFLNHTFFGGTDFVTPIKRSIELIEKKKYRKADILMISDGVAKVPDEFINKINKAKKKFKFEIYSLIVGNENIQDKFSDQIFYYKYKAKEKLLDRSFTRKDVSFYSEITSLSID